MCDPYCGFWALEYERRFPEPSAGELRWLARVARRERPPVCELACGAGRLTIPLARLGFDVTGVDASDDLIRIARQKARREPPAVRERLDFRVGDLRALDIGRRFGFIFIFFGGFECLLSPDEQAAALHRARQHLLPGALLEIELMSPGTTARLCDAAPAVIRRDDTRRDDVLRADVRIVTEQAMEGPRIFVARHRATLRYDDGRTEVHEAVERTRLISHDEMAAAAARAGLVAERVVGGHDHPPRPWTPDAEVMLFDLRPASA